MLEKFGINLSRTNIGSHKTKCPECKNTRKAKNSSDMPLSVTLNADGTAVWNCHNCGHTGGYRPDNVKSFQPKKIEYKKPKEPQTKKVTDELEEWFKGRSISKETMQQFGIYKTEFYFDKERSCCAFPYFVDGELINIKYRTRDKQFRQTPQAKRTLFNIDRVKKHWEESKVKEIIFVEGEMDVLSCYEAGISYAVTLPDGAPSEAKFVEDDKRFDALNNHPWLSDADKVIVATDNDKAGKALQQELVHRFGKDKCWLVDWGEFKDCNEVLQKDKSKIASCLAKAEPFPIDGLFLVKDYRDDVLQLYDHGQRKALSTGFETLDPIYKIMQGTFHLVTGVPNHGKSNFLDQIAVNLAMKHDWKFAIFSPEHSTSMHLRRLIEKICKQPFDRGPTERVSRSDVEIALSILYQRFYFIESEQETPDIHWILHRAKQACMRYGVKGIIIDPYNEICATRDYNKREDEHIRDVISSCKQFCRAHDCVVWVVAHPAKMTRNQDGTIPVPTLYDVSGSAHWNNMADVGIVIHRDFDTDTTRFIVRKVREQGLYGNIGEAYFNYDVTMKTYLEQKSEEEVTSSTQYYNRG